MMPCFLFRLWVVALTIGLLVSSPAFAQSEADITAPEISQDELEGIPVAIDGYDVMTYYTSSGPQKGNTSHQSLYNGKRYLFTSAENQTKFSKDPEKYLPEFEDYCGCALADNLRVMADPKVFKIVNGKLVLFKDEASLSLWNEDEEARYQKARDFWKIENQYDADKRLRENGRARLFTF